MEKIQMILTMLQLVLAASNICILGYALVKFLNKPHSTLEDKLKALEEKLKALELEIREIKQSLLQGNDKFRKQKNTNEVLIHSTLALIEFEIQYCLIEHKEMSKGLEQAKEDLHKYLSQN